MPIERKAYACEHGCGRRLLQSRSKMAAHERGCLLNVDTRSCKTCVHNYAEWTPTDQPGHYGLSAFKCRVEALPADAKIVQGCPSWQELDA